MRIIIADDHGIFRVGLKQIIDAHPPFTVIAEASDGETALSLVAELQPDILISDINMPGKNGFQIAEELKERGSPTKIVFLTMHAEEEVFSKAIQLDVKCYVLKDSATTDIIHCLNAVVAKQNFTSPAMTTYLFKKSLPDERKINSGIADLTEIERKILKLIADYKTSRQIGEELFLSYRTIENYRTMICSKLGLRGSNTLIKFALQNKNEL